MLSELFQRVIDSDELPEGAGEVISTSREGRPVLGFRFGRGETRVSLIAGCHADEPVGPRMLRRLVSFLESVGSEDPILKQFEWWIVPHANPDGEVRNSGWHDPDCGEFNLERYLLGVVREAPGDDLEFGFPRGDADSGVRPESRGIFNWWKSARGPFHLHASLHGMGFGFGPWFLIDRGWVDRCEIVISRCYAAVNERGYVLHDIDRGGEKGFLRVEEGFCTRPDSLAMARHFKALGNEEMASRFRPSSMEAIASLGGEPLTLVSEMPLFLFPLKAEEVSRRIDLAREWFARVKEWRVGISDREGRKRSMRKILGAGLRPMPIVDQMYLQWVFLTAGVEQVCSASTR